LTGAAVFRPTAPTQRLEFAMLDQTLPTLPSAVYIRERLDYDPMTGVFLWRYCEAMPRNWNTRWDGKVSGSVNNGKGYRVIGIDGGLHMAHRLAWIITTGEWPADQLDHINGNRADNRMINLRSVSQSENQRNRAMSSNNTSGVQGVYWRKAGGKWSAAIRVDDRLIHLGFFTHKADAIAARRAAEIAYGFHPNHGRR
jgi:hypothetical protein